MQTCNRTKLTLIEEKRDIEILPIEVFKVGDYAIVIDGHNRAYAFIKMGRSKIPCTLISPIDHRSKLLISFCKNILPSRIAKGITGFENLPIDESHNIREERTLIEQKSCWSI